MANIAFMMSKCILILQILTLKVRFLNYLNNYSIFQVILAV